MKQASDPCRRAGIPSRRTGPTFRGRGAAALPAQRAIPDQIAARSARPSPLVQVFHQEPTGGRLQSVLGVLGLAWRAMPGAVAAAPIAVFYKQVHSAMFGRTDAGVTLEPWLREARHRGVC